MAAGIATLRLLPDGLYRRLEGLAHRLTAGLGTVFRQHDIPHTVDAEGSMFGVFFSEGPVRDLAGAKTADTSLYARFFHAMLERGYYFAPSQFEAAFLSLAHTEAEIDATIDAAGDALEEIRACR
jgi:glutamate-1-semialdehyde 2,1-aminomutase